MKNLLLLFIMLFPMFIFGQTSIETSLDKAYTNAKKGVFWALSNIPSGKNNISKDLVTDEKLIASVKLSKEIGGVKVISIGYCESFEVETKLYKSYESLLEEGYIKYIPQVKL